MPELSLPIGAAFDMVPEPVAYVIDNRILYCNPAFRSAFPAVTQLSALPEPWTEAAASPAGAGALSWEGQFWRLLSWRWGEGVFLRLSRGEDDALLPNRRLPLLAQRMRLPLSSLTLAEEALERAITPFQEKDTQRSFSRMNKARLRLIRLTRTLELAALRDGEAPFDFTPQTVDLNGLCHTAQRELEGLLEYTGCKLTFYDWESSLYASCDDQLVLVLIYHLVSNALKAAGQEGQLELRLERRGGMAHISVSDDGPGMTPAQLSGAFAPQQGDGTLEDAMQGLGLGLTACSRIARLHGGTLLLSNRTPSGLRATFSLPLCQPGQVSELHSGRQADSSNGVPLVLRELSDVLPEGCFSSKDL
jgi:signal transduction histidine kinase